MVKILLLLLIPISLFAQVELGFMYPELPPVAPTRIESNINLDGKLAEGAWAEAEPLENFLQMLPKIGGAPSERTVLKLLYNDNFLYVGVHAYDSFPEKLVATGLERDIFYSSDEGVFITLDTYYDRRQGLLFGTNPLGARFDEEVLDNGNGFNAAFNTFWDVKTSRDSTGYYLEFQIPFSSLRFETSSQVAMGLKVVRYIKHKNEMLVYPPSDPNLSNVVWRVNNTRKIVFENLKVRKPFYLIPYVKSNYTAQSNVDAAGQVTRRSTFLDRQYFVSNATADKIISNIGFDVKYGLTKNFTLDATFNTDFAQAEIDNRIFNFTRFGINLPERRNFFLESRDYLGFSIGQNTLLFNSRNIGIENGDIVPIVGGLRLTGKSNGLQLGVLDLQTKGIEERSIDPQHFTVARLRKEVWGNGSFIGGMFTNRISTSGTSFNNQVIAVDAVRRFRDNKWMASISLASTNDQRTPRFLNESSMAGVFVARVATTGYNHTTNIEYVEKNFRPLVGFAPDTSFFQFSTTNQYLWALKSAKRNLFWLSNQLLYKYRIINSTSELISSDFEVGTSFRNGANVVLLPSVVREYLPYNWNFIGEITLPIGYYTNIGGGLRYDSKQVKSLSYSLTGQLSSFYDGTRLNLLFNGYVALNKNFRITYRYEHNTFSFPARFTDNQQTTHRTNLFSLGVSYTRSIYFSAKALLQYDDVSKTVGANFRLRINPKEGTDFFIVYNPRLNTIFTSHARDRSYWMIDRQVWILKFTKAFSL